MKNKPMLHQAARAAVVLTAIVLVINAATGQPAGQPDKVTVRDKKDGSTKNYDGSLKFAGPAGLQVVSPDGKVLATVSPADIVKVSPGDMAGVDRGAVLAQLSLEDKKNRKDYETARLGYIEMIQKAGTAPPKTKEYLAYKKALVTTKILDEADDDEWSKQAEPTAKEWGDFISEYKTGWEIWPAARACTRLYTELKKFREVENVWKQVTGKDVELPADLKLMANMQMIDAQIRQGVEGYSVASRAADDLLKTAAGAIAKEKLAIYAKTASTGGAVSPEALATTVKELEDKIAASKDPTVRAVGYSMIGELYLAAKRPRDAMWAFLWVETVYNQDKDEVLKALVRLEQIFKSQMDDDHEKMTHEKLRRLRSQL
jgi:hypothetical protein